jgi:hypothetical protein
MNRLGSCVTPWVVHWVSGARLWTNGGRELSPVGVRTGSGVLALNPVVTNRWECEADYSSATSAEFKNLWICTSCPPYAELITGTALSCKNYQAVS